MAEMILDDAYVKIGTVDLSDHVREVRITFEREIQDKSAMGTSARQKKAGLENWTAAITFNQDYDASKVDATLWTAAKAAASTAVEFRADKTAGVGATNPNWEGNAWVSNYQPLAGAVGDLLEAPVSLEGDGVLAREVT